MSSSVNSLFQTKLYHNLYMGNDTVCSRLCEKGPEGHQKEEDILTTEYIVPCQICNTSFKHQALKQHIDLKHFASIREEPNGTIAVECLLCQKVLSDLVEHGNHLNEKHPYAKSESKGRGESVVVEGKESKLVAEWELNKSKKSSALKLQNEKDFQIVKKIDDNRFQAAVYGIKYEVLSFSKEYRGADYYQELVEAELIWFKIFSQSKKCRYYYLDLQPGTRNILCKAYIFLTSQS